MLTLAFAQIVWSIAFQWDNVTGGSNGIVGVWPGAWFADRRSFFALTPDSAHYFFADEDTVIQLNSTGPWGINYVNPKDDPRQKTQ